MMHGPVNIRLGTLLNRSEGERRYQYGEMDLVNHPEAKKRFEPRNEYKYHWSVCDHEVKCNRLFNDAVNCYVFISSEGPW